MRLGIKPCVGSGVSDNPGRSIAMLWLPKVKMQSHALLTGKQKITHQ